MKFKVRLFPIVFLLMCAAGGVCQGAGRGSDSAAMKEATAKLSRADIWKGIKEFWKAVRVAFRESRRENKYNLVREDSFLLSLFTHLVIDKMYDPKMMGPEARNLPAEHLLFAKKAGIRDFAKRLKKLPKDPFSVEKLGWFPLIFFSSCCITTIASRYYPLRRAPNRHVMLVVCFASFILCVGEGVAKVYRMGRRLMRVYQGWVEHLLAQQSNARRETMGWG